MATVPRPRLPFAQKHVTRHGAVVWYVRKGKGPRIRLRAPYGSPEFMAQYHVAIRDMATSAPRKAAAGSIEWLVIQYRDSAAWHKLSTATKRQRENIFKHLIAKAGTLTYQSLTKKSIEASMVAREETPAAARHLLEAIRGMMKFAVKAEYVDHDPTDGIDTPRRKSDGFHSWTEEECDRFEARWPVGTRERLAYDILLYTGLRRGDAVAFGRQHVKNGIATILTQKTQEVVTIRILPQLAKSIAASPTGTLTFITGEKGKPMTKESFGNWFREVCAIAGVPGSAHGLRKAGATRAADAGATGHELMAMYGWRSTRMADIYTRKANRRKLALQGGEKVQKQDENPHTMLGDVPTPENNNNDCKDLAPQKSGMVGEADDE